MKLLFVNPPIGAWATHGNHRAPNQFHAQLIAYARQKNFAQISAIDSRGEELDYAAMLAKAT